MTISDSIARSERSRISRVDRRALIPSISLVVSFILHALCLCVLALIAFRLPLRDESNWIDFTGRTEQPVEELVVDTGFTEVVPPAVVDAPFANSDISLDANSELNLAWQPSGISHLSGHGEGSTSAILPESIAKMVASRGGRVLQGKQRGVSATLQWKGHDDLDLHVEFGREHCFFDKLQTRSLQLDIDANFILNKLLDDPIENIVTRARSSPTGRFRVSVHHYESRNRGASCPFTVFVVVDGACQTFEGEVAPDETKLLFEFERGKPLETDDQIAESKWLTAQTAIKRDQIQTATDLLRDLGKTYPDTEAGKKAKHWLKTHDIRLD